ncbi:helix-turn-helix domain-containing protein [Thermoanaerobacterium thermosaccharolyticum]|uniref:helix-turn-helix domain-containing protein n=1 Tax=Thermoanaerobacterium thermosaccharolyticum TaxID=1517 RepID=UPI003DA85247
MDTFKDRLKQLRNEKNLTQEELAKYIGTTRATLASWETGRREPDMETLRKLSDYFNVTLDWLMGNTDIRNQAGEITDAVSDDPELAEFWNDLKQREDLKLLFKQTRNLSPKAIKQVMRIIKAIEDKESGE